LIWESVQGVSIDAPGCSSSFRDMAKCPLTVIIIGGLFAGAGAVGLVYHAGKFTSATPFPYELALVCFVRVLAIVFGVFLLRGRNWARWGLLVWMAYHVVLSAFHSATEMIMHAALLVVLASFLLIPRRVSAYFRNPKTETDRERETREES
jgi:hypothetical protein